MQNISDSPTLWEINLINVIGNAGTIQEHKHYGYRTVNSSVGNPFTCVPKGINQLVPKNYLFNLKAYTNTSNLEVQSLD